MQKAIKNLSQSSFIFFALCITIVIAVLSLIEPSKSPKLAIFSFNNSDKVQHFLAYLTLGLSWLFALKTIKWGKRIKIIVVFCCIIFGIIIEVLQGTITTFRTPDYKDIVANTLGVLLALVVFNKIANKKK